MIFDTFVITLVESISFGRVNTSALDDTSILLGLTYHAFAEWGYISMEELIDNGARQDRSWKPCTYEETMKKIKEYRGGQNQL